MPKVEEVVVLEPLGQVGEVDHLPGLELVPDGDGELLGLLGRVHHHLGDGEVAFVSLGGVVRGPIATHPRLGAAGAVCQAVDGNASDLIKKYQISHEIRAQMGIGLFYPIATPPPPPHEKKTSRPTSPAPSPNVVKITIIF